MGGGLIQKLQQAEIQRDKYKKETLRLRLMLKESTRNLRDMKKTMIKISNIMQNNNNRE